MKERKKERKKEKQKEQKNNRIREKMKERKKERKKNNRTSEIHSFSQKSMAERQKGIISGQKYRNIQNEKENCWS